MQKNHLSQNRPHPQTQAPSMPSTRTYILDENEGNGSQPASMSLNEPEDDDDICPVCESECTCANRSRNIMSPPAARDYATGYIVQDVSNKISGTTSPTTRPASLKIKLTLPPRPQQIHASTSSKSSNRRSFLPKQKFKADIEDGAGKDIPRDSLSSVSSESLISGRAHDVQSDAKASVPKKRGRPSKAVIAARGAVKRASEARRLNGVTDQSIGNVVGARQSTPSTSRGAPRATPSTSGKRKSKKLHGAAAASRARAQQRRAQARTQVRKKKQQTVVDENENESSELSDLDDDDDHPFGLPTFVPALSSSSASSSSDSGSDTDSDLDKGIPPEPRPHQTSSLLIADNEFAQRKREYHNTWDIRVRKRSVGAEGSSDEGMETDSGEGGEEEEEEEGDDEADENDEDPDADGNNVQQQAIRYSGIATGWTDDEESSFDADLFFANLNDSSAGESDDEQMADDDDVFVETGARGEIGGVSSADGFDAFRLSEIAAAGFLAPFADLDRSTAENLPFGQGWDHLSLSSTFRDTLMDLDAESSRRLPLGSLLEPPIPGYEDAEAMMATSEEEEAVAMFDSCSQVLDEEEVVEIFEDSEGGDTTEDEYVDVDGIATPRREVLLRFPASLGAIDPMSTLSSSLKGPVVQEVTSSPKLRRSSRTIPKPSDFLSGRASVPGSKDATESKLRSQSSKQAASAPTMGCFVPQASDKTKCAVIARSDNSARKAIPCPYPAVRRLRGRGTSVSMLSHSGSDRSFRSRTPSLLAAARSTFDKFTSGDLDSTDDSQLPPGEPIQLDDVIDSKFLEPEKSDGALPESTTSETGEAGETGETCESESERDRHFENLRRWDRIPIDAFRKTRALGAANNLADEMNIVISTPRAPRPSDGFSYGSAVGGMMRGSPLSATLWESSPHAEHHGAMTPGNRRGKLSSLLVSPVLLPSRDGDHTPTAERQQQRLHQHGSSVYAGQHAAYTQQNIKSRKELRKEKKRSRKFFGPAAPHIRHNHFPNAKSRATSSMQRIPSLSL